MANKWIQGAISPRGLDRQGQGGGVSLSQFMQEKHKDSTTNREIALARRLREMARNHKGKGKK